MSEFNKIKSNLDLSPKHIKNTVNVTILSTFSLSIITFIVYYIYNSIGKVPNNNILKLLIPAVIFGGLLIGGVYYSISYKTDDEYDFVSSDRMENINSVFTSYFGNRWPMIFACFGILL